jgi:exoribonuclease-2
MGGGVWLVRAEDLPLMFSVLGAQGLLRGARVRVKLGEVDLMALDVQGTVTAHLDATLNEGLPEEKAESDEEDDEALAAAPLAIAVDLSDSTHSDGS